METHGLSNEAKVLRNKYYKEWREKNKDKVAEINRRYWEKKLAMVGKNEEKTEGT